MPKTEAELLAEIEQWKERYAFRVKLWNEVASEEKQEAIARLAKKERRSEGVGITKATVGDRRAKSVGARN